MLIIRKMTQGLLETDCISSPVSCRHLVERHEVAEGVGDADQQQHDAGGLAGLTGLEEVAPGQRAVNEDGDDQRPGHGDGEADSVAVKAPDRMPPRMITTTNRPGSAARKALSTATQPGNLPLIG